MAETMPQAFLVSTNMQNDFQMSPRQPCHGWSASNLLRPRGVVTTATPKELEDLKEEILGNMAEKDFDLLNNYTNAEFEEQQMEEEMLMGEMRRRKHKVEPGPGPTDHVQEVEFPTLEEIFGGMCSDDEAPTNSTSGPTRSTTVEPVKRVKNIQSDGSVTGLGRRKCSSARVWMRPAAKGMDATFVVNGRDYADYFKNIEQRLQLIQPFLATNTFGQFDIVTRVQGGGVNGQAGAVVLGLARALQDWDPAFRPNLKRDGLMTRDQRMVERKKPGKPKARKSFQWVKR